MFFINTALSSTVLVNVAKSLPKTKIVTFTGANSIVYAAATLITAAIMRFLPFIT